MKRKLEEVVRARESTDDLVLLLRGGPDTKEKILRHADRLEDLFTYQDGLARGSHCSQLRVTLTPGRS